MNKKKISVVIPVYNSEDTLNELHLRLEQYFHKANMDYEIIFVEDGSTDKSWAVLCAIKAKDPEHTKAIRLAKNFGQHNAIICGFTYMEAQFVITIDDDLQIPPEEIGKLIAKQNETHADIVYGNYRVKKHGFKRNVGSLVVQKIFRQVFRTKGNITSFRMLKADLVESVLNHKQSFVFIDGLLHWYTRDIAYCLVEHNERSTGKSGYNFAKLLKLASNLLFNFTTFPLKMVIWLGIGFSLFSFIVGMIFVIRKMIYNVPIGYTSIIVSLFFIGSIILLVIGIIGEYVSRIFSLENKKPQFVVKEII